MAKLLESPQCVELNNNDGYILIWKDVAQIDGWFTATELRQIADKMDELQKEDNNGTGIK